MEFYEFRTQWEHIRKHPYYRTKYLTMDEWYNEMKMMSVRYAIEEGMKGCTVLHNQSMAESTWYKQNKPYYKLYHDMIHLLARTNIDVPCEFLRTPFPAFTIRLPVNHGIDFLSVEDQELRSMLVDESPDQFEINPNSYTVRSTGHRNIIVWMDFGETEHDFQNKGTTLDLSGMPVVAYNRLSIDENESIETCLSRNKQEGTEGRICDEGIPITTKMADLCFRIAVAVCFLSTGADKIVEPDVLSKDLRKYLNAKEQVDTYLIEQLINKAKRRGKFGWTIGREIIFPNLNKNSHGKGTAERELHYAHQRCAHFHTYRFGPKKSLAKVKFIRQLTVRPDLPAPPSVIRRGYKINSPTTKGG